MVLVCNCKKITIFALHYRKLYYLTDFDNEYLNSALAKAVADKRPVRLGVRTRPFHG